MTSRNDSTQNPSRRNFLKLAGAATLGAMAPSWVEAKVMKPERWLHLLNLHTGESASVVYWVKGQYINEGLWAINHVLRDHHNGEVAEMDPKLFDLLYAVSANFGRRPINIISAYRSPETNEMLRQNSEGVAKHSYHVKGQAIDLRVPGVPLRQLKKASLAQRAGGVGYYPSSDFIHLDTGPIRTW